MSSDCTLQPVVKNPESGLAEILNQQRRDSSLPICAPQSPDLVPVRLPSLTSSVTTFQWRLSHEENPQFHNHSQAEDTTRSKCSLRDLSLPRDSKIDEAAIYCATSQPSETNIRSTSPLRSHDLLATLACSNSEMRPSFSDTSIHLQSMRISQHLRSMSTASIDNSICGREAGSIHNGTKTVFEDRQLPRRARCTSSTGFESKNLPLTWGKVVKDDASSIYSSVTQASGSSIPSSSNNIRRRLSVETVRAGMQSPTESILQFNFGEGADATPRDPGWIFEHELKNSSGNEIAAIDGGRSTPSLADTNTRSLRQFSFAVHSLPVPEKQNLVTKKSGILNGGNNFRGLLPRSRTKTFLNKRDSINNLDGTEERQSRRSKSMYGLHSEDKDFKFLGLLKKHPLENKISMSFSFSSPVSAAKSLNEEAYRTSKLDKIEEKSPGHDETEAFRQCKSMHQLKPECRENLRGKSAPSQQNSGSWSKYPSRTRAERNGNAGPRDFVYPKDFALQPKGESSSNRVKDQSSNKANTSKRSKKSRIAKSRSVIFGKSVLKSYARLFKHQSVEFQRYGHGHKSSISVSGVTEYPELEMVASIFPTTTDNNGSQSATCQRSNLTDTRTADRGPDSNAARRWSQIYQSCVELCRSSEDVSKWSFGEDKVGDPTEDSFELKARSGSAQGHGNSIQSSGKSVRDSTEELAKVLQETEANEYAKVKQIAQDD